MLFLGLLSFGRFRPEVEKVAETDVMAHARSGLRYLEALELNRHFLAVEDEAAVSGEDSIFNGAVFDFSVVLNLVVIGYAVEGEDAFAVLLRVAHDVGVEDEERVFSRSNRASTVLQRIGFIRDVFHHQILVRIRLIPFVFRVVKINRAAGGTQVFEDAVIRNGPERAGSNLHVDVAVGGADEEGVLLVHYEVDTAFGEIHRGWRLIIAQLAV